MESSENVIETKKENDLENENKEGQTLLKEIKDFSSKNLFIINKELEEKISNILLYIQSEKNEIINKLEIIKYLISLIKNVQYNLEIILAHTSAYEKKKLNLYEILIDQYIYTDKNEKEYIKNLDTLLNLIFFRLSYNKNIYRYILSYISNYMNQKNNNDDSSEKINLNEYNYSQILNLILNFYKSKKDDIKPINYLFFNGNKDTNLSIHNDNEILDLNKDLYILFFIKLIDYEYLSKLFENDKKINTILNLIEITFKNNSHTFKINIDYTNSSSLTTDYKEKINNINIPYNLFSSSEINNFLVKITTDNQIEIYINGLDINIPKNSSSNKNISVENIIFSGEFYGIITSIMIYKDKNRNKMENLIPNYFLEKQPTKKENIKFIFSNIYKGGFDEEYLLSYFIKADMKERVNVKNIHDTSIYSGEIKNENYIEEIRKFITYNLISLYIPTRMIIGKEKENKKIFLVDSFKNLKAVLNINELYPNHLYSKYGGLSLLKDLLTDFYMDLNGINHLLPCIEIMINNPELLSTDNLSSFMSIILNLIINFNNMISVSEDNNFFYLLSQFLEKIPEERKSDLHAFIKSILITLQSFESGEGENNLFNLYIQDFFNNVCMNEKILYKFDYEERSLIYKKIYEFLINASKINIDINIANIINILLSLEKNKYTHFCCKTHAQYFNKESQIMEPELKQSVKPILNIIQIIFNQYYKDIKDSDKQKLLKGKKEIIFDSQAKLIKLFEILTFDITPCLQFEILKLYYDFIIQNKNPSYFECLNINNTIVLIIIFLFKTSLFDIKEIAFNFIYEFLNKNEYKEFLGHLDKYVTYFYYPRNKTNENLKVYQNLINIGKINHNYLEENENKKKFMENYNKNHYNIIMEKLFNKSRDIFLNRKILLYFNILLEIASKNNSDFILKFLNLVKEEMSKKVPNIFNLF